MKNIRYLTFAFVIASCGVAASEQATIGESERDSLRQFAFDGMCSYFVDREATELSPSTREMKIFSSCWGYTSEPQVRDYASAIYVLHLDCPAKTFAIVESRYFDGQFWAGPSRLGTQFSSLSWRPLSKTFKHIKRQCLPDKDKGMLMTDFDGPDSDAWF